MEKFNNDKEYFAHVCNVTGFTPNQIEHLDATSNGAFSEQSRSALSRGAVRKEKARLEAIKIK
jgi:hypothetical protein